MTAFKESPKKIEKEFDNNDDNICQKKTEEKDYKNKYPIPEHNFGLFDNKDQQVMSK